LLACANAVLAFGDEKQVGLLMKALKEQLDLEDKQPPDNPASLSGDEDRFKGLEHGALD
jgi:hypothetical protein